MVKLRFDKSKRRYKNGRKIYKYDRITLVFPTKYHDVLKSFREKQLSIRVVVNAESISILLTEGSKSWFSGGFLTRLSFFLTQRRPKIIKKTNFFSQKFFSFVAARRNKIHFLFSKQKWVKSIRQIVSASRNDPVKILKKLVNFGSYSVRF